MKTNREKVKLTVVKLLIPLLVIPVVIKACENRHDPEIPPENSGESRPSKSVDPELLKAKAESGDSEALRSLVEILLASPGEPHDAASWYEKSAHEGQAIGQYALYLYLRQIKGDAENRWMPLLESACAQEHPDALYHRGQIYGDRGELDKAIECFRGSAESGLALAKAALGQCLFYGRENPEDIDQGLKLLLEAAQAEVAFAHTTLGKIYYEGVNVEKDVELGLRHSRKAADLGDPKAMANLAMHHYLRGEFKIAAKYLRQGAKLDDAECQARLATLYLNGEGVPRNVRKAAELTVKAAKKEHREALELIQQIQENDPWALEGLWPPNSAPKKDPNGIGNDREKPGKISSTKKFETEKHRFSIQYPKKWAIKERNVGTAGHPIDAVGFYPKANLRAGDRISLALGVIVDEAPAGQRINPNPEAVFAGKEREVQEALGFFADITTGTKTLPSGEWHFFEATGDLEGQSYRRTIYFQFKGNTYYEVTIHGFEAEISDIRGILKKCVESFRHSRD